MRLPRIPTILVLAILIAIVATPTRAQDASSPVDDIARCLSDAAELRQSGSLEAADARFNECIAAASSDVEQPLVVADLLHDAGTQEAVKGDLGAAKRLITRAFELREQCGGEPVDVARSLHSLGYVANREGDVDGARDDYERALGLLERHAPESLDIAKTLNNLGNLVKNMGDLATARVYLERSVEIAAKNDPESLYVARSLANLGMLARDQGDRDAARRFNQRALEIRTRRAPDSLLVAKSLSNLGALASDLDSLQIAQDYFERALAIREQQAPDSPDFAESLLDLGNIASKRGDLATARQYHQRALEISEAHDPGSLRVSRCLLNLGLVAWRRGDLAAARTAFERVVEIREQRAPGSIGLAWGLNNLGLVARQEGRRQQAKECYERAHAIFSAQAPGSTAVATTLVNLGTLASDSGDLREARWFFEQGLAIYEQKAPGSLAVARCLYNLGCLAREQSDGLAARRYFDRALVIYETIAPGSLSVAMTLDNIGALISGQGELAEARDILERSLAIKEEHAPESLSLAWCLNNLGYVSRKQGRYDEAHTHYQRALAISERQAPGSHAVAQSLLYLANLEEHRGDFAAARTYGDRALAIRERIAPGSLKVADSLTEMGRLAHSSGDLAESADYYAQAWRIYREQSRAVVGDEARQAYGARVGAIAENLIEIQLAAGSPDLAFETLEQARAQSLLWLLSERDLGPMIVAPDVWKEFRQSESDMQEAGSVLADAGLIEARLEHQLSESQNEGLAGEKLRTKNLELVAARAAREQALARYTETRVIYQGELARIRRAVPGLEPISDFSGAAVRALPAEALYLAFAVGAERTWAFYILDADASRIRCCEIDMGSDELGRRVSSLLERIQAGRRGAESEEMLQESTALFEILFPAEIRPHLATVDRLIVSPDGPLWQLPFAALAFDVQGEQTYLGMAKPISYTPSLTVTVAGAVRKSTMADAGAVLVVGDPVFVRDDASWPADPSMRDDDAWRIRGLEQKERWSLFGGDEPPPRIPGTREEATQIASLYGCDPLLGADATESAVRTRLPGARIVHLATHGYFHPVRGLNSGVLLTPPDLDLDAKAPASDGALQAWEFMSNIELVAEVVVLSACETGRGDVVRGEGLVGLTRALQVAGASTVVATHWQIADVASADLMVDFHRNLLSGMAKDEALRAAMAAAVARGHKDPLGHAWLTHPYYWAGFFLTGDATGSI